MKYPDFEHDQLAHEQNFISDPTRRSANKPKRSFFRKFLRFVGGLILLGLVSMAVGGGVAGGYVYSLYRELPSIARLEAFSPSLVTTVFDRKNEQIGEFFIEKRTLVTFADLPANFINALLAAEDKRFFQHFGVDPIGFGRALLANLRSGKFGQGASTLTQQLTRGLFLSPEKKVPRKIKEWMLAVQIEQRYKQLEQDSRKAKQKILELYANQFYWGHGAYGVAAAAKLYFGKELNELDLGECAMLAGLIQLPAVYSPLIHPEIAKKRQTYVLNRMVVEGYIRQGTFRITGQTLAALRGEKDFPADLVPKLAALQNQTFATVEAFRPALEQAIGKELTAQYQSLIMPAAAEGETANKALVQPFKKKPVPERQLDKAPYFVEYVRQYLEDRYGSRVYQDGLQVYTTLDLHLQDAAQKALQEGLRSIQKRHGFKLLDREKTPEERAERLQAFAQTDWKNPPEKGQLLHAVVTKVEAKQIQAQLKDFAGTIDADGFKWAGKDPAKLAQADDIVLVKVLEVDAEKKTVKLALDLEPLLEGAFLAIEPKTGHILAMIGGYDFYRSKFNRAVQALRQPGSSFKPFIYLSALERGLTPADVMVDEPISFQNWSPKNFSGTFEGAMTIRYALEHSVNVIAAKLIEQIGPPKIVDTARRLGINSYLNPYPSLALGGSEVLLVELVSAYCTFANRGFRVEPIAVTKVLDRDGKVLEENVPRARQAVAEDVNYILVSLLEGVCKRGTAAAANKLGRPVGGKTGTTNDTTDALFVGFSPTLAAGVWVGYDENRKSIGAKETGGRAALPIWIDFMAEALKDTAVEDFPVPPGVRFVQIERKSGLLAAPQCGQPFTEVFKKGTEPKEYCYQKNYGPISDEGFYTEE